MDIWNITMEDLIVFNLIENHSRQITEFQKLCYFPFLFDLLSRYKKKHPV
jgi:hypothetical protein